MIAVVERGRKNKEILVIENIDKIAMIGIAKVSNAIYLGKKYIWAISNANINAARN